MSELTMQPVGNPKQVDPNVHLPPAVRAAAERAEQLQREMRGEPPQNGAEPAPAPPQNGAEPAPAPPQRQEGPPTGGPPPLQNQSETQPQQGELFEPPQQEIPEESWKQRYDAEHGRTERARRDNEALSNRINDLENMLATIKVTNYEAPPPRERTFTSSLTDKEREEWGEVLPVIEKQAKDLIAPLEAELQDKIAQVEEQLKNVGKQTAARAKSEFLAMLDTHPQIGINAGENCWRVLNNDDVPGGFVPWAKGYDRRSGRQMIGMLQDAYDTNDAIRFAAFFEDYLREQGRLAPPPPQSNGSAAAGHAPPAPGNGLERYAVPGRPKSAAVAPASPAQPDIFTQGDVQRFYEDKRRGRWTGRETEMDAYERTLLKASSEGRVRPGPPQP